MRARKLDYISFDALTEIKVGQTVMAELPDFSKVQSAKVAANTLKNRGVGEWSIHLVTNNIIEISRKG